MQKVTIGNWDLKISESQRIFPDWAINQSVNLLGKWGKIFPQEGTWSELNFNIPSLIVRMDCTINIIEGNLAVYEIEERPAGIGIASLVNPQFKENFERLRKEWPPFKVLLSPRRNGGDDYLWGDIALSPTSNGLLLVRAEPEEREFWSLVPRAVAPIRNKGAKGYGVSLGLWSRVSDPELLPWREAFVLKPLQGSKCRGVEIWVPGKKKIPGSSTRTRILKVLKEKGEMYLQKFFPPLKIELGGEEFWGVFRFFFGFSLKKNAYVPLGGVWMARKNLRLHGASDAVTGPLLF